MSKWSDTDTVLARARLIAAKHPDSPSLLDAIAHDSRADTTAATDGGGLRFVCPECGATYYGRHAADTCCPTPEPAEDTYA
jgi:hypothetical protein